MMTEELKLFSKNINKGDTFVCIPHENAMAHCLEAVKKGATTLVVQEDLLADLIINLKTHVHITVSKNPRLWLAEKLKETVHQPKICIAVTGTNGKSSVVHYIYQIYTHLGYSAASLGTLGLTCSKNMPIELKKLTTQDPLTFYNILNALYKNQIDCLAYEASSHGLEQHRIDFCKNSVVAFTNLTHDHLDYHKSMDDYFTAKKRLFVELASESTPKVINGEDPYGKKLASLFDKNVFLYGQDKSYPFSYDDDSIYLQGHSLKREALIAKHDIHIQNILCACACAVSAGVGVEEIIKAIPSLAPPKGRLEEIKENVFVDFAHTPNGLENAILSLRKGLKGKLITVFGCGGNRDKTKRPEMGRIASTLSDTVIITDDNARYENPAKIREEIAAGCNTENCHVLLVDRRKKAIEMALSLKTKNDVVLIAGKGDENTLEINGKKHPFSDQQVILTLVS